MGEVAVTTTEWLFVLNFHAVRMKEALRSSSQKGLDHPTQF
jgi:hypothetical protein